MRVCLISNQIAHWGKVGGFGTATRAIGAGLVRRGIETYAVVPQRAQDGQSSYEVLDGIEVVATSRGQTLLSGNVFRDINADIYHSQEPTIATLLAQRAMPDAVHLVTCRDPRGLSDHLVELRHTNLYRRLIFPFTWYYEGGGLVRQAVRRAHKVFCAAPCLEQRIKRLYGDDVHPQFLPSPVDIPQTEPVKATTPLVLFVGRWDHRKRIERFFELAAEFPQVRFVAVGRAHDARYDRRLRERYGNLPNVEMPGFLSRFGNGGLYELYAQAWVLVNTSAREGLPYTFVEALAFGCALLSVQNPDDFASRFGFHVTSDEFSDGLNWLLERNRWRQLGAAGAQHVREVFHVDRSLDLHIEQYTAMLSHKRRAA